MGWGDCPKPVLYPIYGSWAVGGSCDCLSGSVDQACYQMVEFAVCCCLKPAAPVLMEDQSQWSWDNTLVFPVFQVASLIAVACLIPACFCCVLVLVVAAPLAGLIVVWMGLGIPSSLKVCCPNRQTVHPDLINNLIPRIKCPVAEKKTCGAFWPRQSCCHATRVLSG